MPRRTDETPTLEVIANVLGGVALGLLLILLGNTIRAGDEHLVDLGPDLTQ